MSAELLVTMVLVLTSCVLSGVLGFLMGGTQTAD